MAIKREMNITLKFKDGSTLDLTGDTAQRVYQEYMGHVDGGIRKALKYTNSNGDQEFIEFSCLYGLVVKAQTETIVPDIPCGQVDCIADYPS